MNTRTSILFAAVVAPAFILGTVTWRQFRLPAPKKCNHQQLLRWLTTRDLSQESSAIQLGLVDRIQAEIKSLEVRPEKVSTLEASTRQRLSTNAQLLKHVWFLCRVNEFTLLSATESAPFLDDQIEFLYQWTRISRAVSNENEGTKEENPSDVSAFFDDVEEWIKSSHEQLADEMRQAVRAGVIRWLCTGDLTQQPMATRVNLSRRIDNHFDSNPSLDVSSSTVTDAENENLQSNAELLLEAWFLDQSRIVAEKPEKCRPEYVDRQIDRVMSWPIGHLVSDGEGNGKGESINAVKLISMVTQWINQTSGKDKLYMQKLVAHIQTCLLKRALFGGSSP